MARIEGNCDSKFQGVCDAFAENFEKRGDVGAAVAVELDGRPVVDLWGGWMDAERKRPWERDTLVDVFSVGKAMAAVALLLLVERGRVDLDAPVARLWPGVGKETITPGTVLA